jgi:hypothetical protein
MTQEFVPFELAVKLKTLGFNEPCLAGYSTSSENLEYYSRPLITKDSFTVDVPLYQQAFRWFREKYKLSVLIHDCLDDYIGEIVEWTIAEDKVIHEVYNRIDTYEETELACLEKLIEIVENK